MKAARRSRWALSFADLCLLLLGFFVLLQARREEDRKQALTGLNGYFSEGERPAIRSDIPAAQLFVPGEAILTEDGHARLGALARTALNSRSALRLSSRGVDSGTARFDGWDLASARVGAVARALARNGFPADRVRISGPESDAQTGEKGQTLTIRSEH
jgi:hypothetical protein